MSLRAYVSGALVAALAVGCVSANKRAVEYRNKGRERFAEGKYDLAVVDYRQAKAEDKAGKIEGLEAERERAASEHVRKLLKDAWGKFDRGEFQQAHALLIVIKNATELSNKITDPQVVRSLGDTAAMAWEEVEALKKRRFYLRAMLLGDYLVKPLPPGHAMRTRYDALKVSAIGFHMAKMRALKQSAPNAAAFHYLVAKRLGGDTDVDGLELIAAVKRASGDASTYNSAGKSASGDKAEDNYVLGRQLGNSWDASAITHYGNAYGMNDARYLDEVWNGTTTLEPYPAAAAITLPAPDDVQVAVSVDPSPDSGPRFKSLDFYYQIGAHTLAEKTLSTGAGGAYRFPSKSGKMTYELSGFFESATLGGETKGYGGDLLITALVKSPLVMGAGIGYLKDEVTENAITGMELRQKSVHIPIVARAALGAGYAASLEARINILQFSGEKMPIPEEQHYSPVSLRMYGPIPLLGDVGSPGTELEFAL